MKLFVEVHYYMKPGMRDAFYRAVKEESVISGSLSEPGCLKYDYYFSPEDPDEILLLECWTDAQAQAAHSHTPHYNRLAGLKSIYVERAEVLKYPTEA